MSGCRPKIIEQYHRSDDARWYGMGLSQHIGFTNWNEDECKNPLLMQELPLQKPTIIATVDGTVQHVEGSPWLNQRMTISDFLNPECRCASISLYSRSELPASFRVIEKPEWIVLSAMDGTLDGEEHKRLTIDVTVDESALAMALTDGRTQGMIRLELPAGICKISVPVDRQSMNMETIRLWIHRDGSQSRRNITADARTVLIGKDNRCNGNVLPATERLYLR